MSKKMSFFLKHLIVSVLLSCLAMVLVLWVWYPAPLDKAVGVMPLLAIMLFINIVVAPLLGLLVYKQGKKTLKMDLAVIIALQLIAFGYGMFNIAQGRPAWIVYGGVGFHLVKNSDIDKTHITMAEPQFQQPKWTGPSYANLKKQGSSNALDAIFKKSPSNYSVRDPVNYEPMNKIDGRLLPLSLLEEYNDKVAVEQVLAKYPQADAWVGLDAPVQNMVVLINEKEGSVVDIVDLKPWD